jgi:hypothetical protein
MAKINFNGQEYDSPEAMPAEVRRLYELANQMFADKDQDGVPDLFQGIAGTQANVVQTSQFVVDGKVYTSLDELPEDARRRYEQAMGQLDANRNGVPDMLEGGLFGATAQPPAAPPAQPAPAPELVQVVGDRWPLGARILIVGLIVLLLVAAAAIFYLSR